MPQWASKPDHVGSDGRTTPYLASWFVHLPCAKAAASTLRHLELEEDRQSDWVVSTTIGGLKDKAKRIRAPMRQGFRFKSV
mmetsp:Transcript_1650/g.4127  ORF Transcript_1650/g.4127 Transcript_1650/m.4127 type:complete len:81 (+) Transcript_1650:714-956(+)